MSSASLNDPSTGDFDLELPSGAVESVEVLSNPFAAEYGRFSTSVTQVRTKRGTNDWVFKPDNLVPGFGKGFAFVNKFEPRLSISGPLKRDRLLLGQYMQYRFARTKVKSLPGRAAARSRQLRLVHTARRGVVVASRAHRRRHLFPAQDHQRDAVDVPARRRRRRSSRQEGFSAGLVDRLILSAHAVLESTSPPASSKSIRRPRAPRRWSTRPQGQSGNFFNRQERNVRSLQLVEALTISKDRGPASTCSRSAWTSSTRASTATATASELDVGASTARSPSGRRIAVV